MIFRHYLDLLSQYRRLIFGIVVFATLGTALLSTALLFVMPMYTGEAKVVMLPLEEELQFTEGWVRGSAFNPANVNAATHMEYLLSRPVAERALASMLGKVEPAPPPTGWKAEIRDAVARSKQWFWETYSLLNYGKYVPPTDYEATLHTLMESIELEMVEGSFVLLIEVTYDDPRIAAMAANALAKAYVELMAEEASASSLEIEKFLRAEIQDKRESVSDLSLQNLEVARLHDRIIEVRLARSNVLEQVRIIDPAQVPVYPSFPKVLIYSVLAFVASILVAAFAVVAIDTFSGTIKTGSDLRRLVGDRAAGFFPRRLLRAIGRGRRFGPLRRRALARLGEGLERQLAVLGLFGAPRIFVTGFADEQKTTAGTLTLAAALASRGAKVECGFPLADTLPVLPRDLEEGNLQITSVDGESRASGVVRVDCAGPLSVRSHWPSLTEDGSSIICLVPIGAVLEEQVQEFETTARRHGTDSVAFVLIDA